MATKKKSAKAAQGVATPANEVTAEQRGRMRGVLEMFMHAARVERTADMDLTQPENIRTVAGWIGVPYLLIEILHQRDMDPPSVTFDDIEELQAWMANNGYTREFLEQRKGGRVMAARELQEWIGRWLADLIRRGFLFPIHGTFISRNGYVLVFVFTRDANGADVKILAEYDPDTELNAPINIMFVDARGESAHGIARDRGDWANVNIEWRQ